MVESRSFWIATTERPSYPELDRDLRVDVAVVGAGIVGITTALLLGRAGKSVALLEARRVAEGVTGHTTAKVTSLHTLIYAHLASAFGEEKARLYGEANQAALDTIRRLCAEHELDCELEERTAYTFAEDDSDVSQIEREVEAAQALGLPASYHDELPLPFGVAAAVGFAGQAAFHPRKYLLPLAAAVVRDGGFLFERTRVVDVEEGATIRLRTDSGHTVTADDAVLATSLPIVNRGLFFARADPYRGYALALEAGSGGAPDGMFVNTASPTRSVRPARHDGREVLVVSGEGHRVGEDDEGPERWARLERWARTELGAGDVLFRWSTQDYSSIDRVPFVGRMQPGSRRLLTATGFGAWGMTNGTVAGMLLADLVLGVDNPWQEVFDPARLNVRSLPALAKKGVHDASRLVGDRVRGGETETVDDVPAGEGRIVDVEGEKLAVHRDEEGRLHAVGATCTHMGCIVRWNGAERSWDCPCHGSRFAPDGSVLQAPAARPLEDRRSALEPPPAA